MRVKYFFLLLFCPVYLFCYPYQVERIDVTDGLSNDYITSIAEDKTGFMWFATDWGLNRFDGNSFTTYKFHPDELNTLRNNALNVLLADTVDNILWIGTQRVGLSAFDCTTQTFIHYPYHTDEPNSTKANGITDLCMGTDNTIWIAAYQNGLKKLNKETNEITHITLFENWEQNGIWTVTDDFNGHLYLGHLSHGMSILSLKDQTVKSFLPQPDDPNSIGGAVRQILIDSNRNVWLATNKGLALFHPDTEKFTVFHHDPANPNSISSNEIYCLRQVGNELWVGTERGGISILTIPQHIFSSPSDITFRHIQASGLPTDLSSMAIRRVFQDSHGNIWIGSYGGGINFISHQPKFFNTIAHFPVYGLSSKIARCLSIDKENRLWIGTGEGGVDVFQNGIKIKHYSRENHTLPDNNLISSLIDSNGDIWFGTGYEGLVRYNKQRDRFEKSPITDLLNYSFGYNNVQCIFEDDRHRLWVGSNGGIVVYDLNTHKHTLIEGQEYSLPNNLIRCIAQDTEGNFWIGTLNDGVIILTPDFKVKKTITYDQGISNGINHIYRDFTGRMWIGARNGLVLCVSLEQDEYEIFNEANGLSDSFVRAIAEGANGEMWISTNEGISCFQEKTRTFENYDRFDGVPPGTFLGGAVATTGDGTIYMGSQNGLCFFNAHRSRDFTIQPVNITGFSVHNKKRLQADVVDRPITSNNRLKYNENSFTIGFNVMDYSLQSLVEYSYYLKGIDNAWYETNEQQATFRNIPPGRYNFQVRARIRGQEWPEQATSLPVEIIPPFWLSWWAKLIYILSGILIVYFVAQFYKRRIHLENQLFIEKENLQKEQELNDDKLKFYTNVAHELRTPLTLIIGPLGDMLTSNKIPAEESEKLSLIHRSAMRLSNLINQILEFRKSETQNRSLYIRRGDISTLINEVGMKYKTLNQNKDIDIEIVNQSHDTVFMYDEEIVTIVLDNLISNALKYTYKGSIQIIYRNLTEGDKQLFEIEVKDTGVGIPANGVEKIFDRYYQVKGSHQASGSGIGLSLVKNLVTLHEGNISVKSEVDEGTSFYVQFDMRKTYMNALLADSDNQTETENKDENAKPLILIVEDDEDIRRYIASSLSGLYDTLMAENGEEGVEIALKEIPDIIVSDIMMPIMDGINLTKTLKEDIRTSHIPIILLTAKDTLKDKAEGYSVGADSYITKPFSASLLRARIENLLESRKKILNFISTNTYKKMVVENSAYELDNEFIEKTIAIIENNMEQDITINFLAGEMYMSNSTFYRKIKALTGISGNEFIRKIKMQHAEQMILSQKHSITEIAYKVGYNSLTQFRRVFKAEFGMSPSDYIKRAVK